MSIACALVLMVSSSVEIFCPLGVNRKGFKSPGMSLGIVIIAPAPALASVSNVLTSVGWFDSLTS